MNVNQLRKAIKVAKAESKVIYIAIHNSRFHIDFNNCKYRIDGTNCWLDSLAMLGVLMLLRNG